MKVEIILFIFVLIALADARKRKKKQREKKVEDPLDRRPSNLSAELYCDSCQAIIKEAVKELRGKKKESDVYDIMENVCNPEKFYTYHHPPPEMREGCEAFLSGWNDEIISSLTNRANDDEPVNKLCYEISKACENVDPSNVPKMDNNIMVDGEKMDISSMMKTDM